MKDIAGTIAIASDVGEHMKTKKRYKNKYLIDIKSILIEHINSNLRDYLILSIIFIIGVMVGVILINNSSEQSKIEISGYINSFIDAIKDENYEVDKFKLIQISIVQNIKTIAVIWLAGSTIIGIPLIYVITAYKGFCIGYTISAIISSLGVGKRNCLLFSITLLTEYNYYSYNFNA